MHDQQTQFGYRCIHNTVNNVLIGIVIGGYSSLGCFSLLSWSHLVSGGENTSLSQCGSSGRWDYRIWIGRLVIWQNLPSAEVDWRWETVNSSSEHEWDFASWNRMHAWNSLLEEDAWHHILTHCCGRECMVPYFHSLLWKRMHGTILWLNCCGRECMVPYFDSLLWKRMHCTILGTHCCIWQWIWCLETVIVAMEWD